MPAPTPTTPQTPGNAYEEFLDTLTFPYLQEEAYDASYKRTLAVEKYTGDQSRVIFTAEPVFQHLLAQFDLFIEQPIDEIIKTELRPDEIDLDHYEQLFAQFEEIRELFRNKEELYARVSAIDPSINKEDVLAYRFVPASINDFFLQLQLFREFQGRFAEAHMDPTDKDYIPPTTVSRYVSLGPKLHIDSDDGYDSASGESPTSDGFADAWNPGEQEFYIDNSPIMLAHARDASAYAYLLDFYEYIRDVWPDEWDDDIPPEDRDPARKHSYDEVGMLVCTVLYKQYIDSYLEWLDTYPEERGEISTVPDTPWDKVVNDAFNKEQSHGSEWTELQRLELEAAALSTAATEIISTYLFHADSNRHAFSHKGLNRYLNALYRDRSGRGGRFDDKASLGALLGLDDRHWTPEDAQTIKTLKAALHHYCQVLLDPESEKDLIELVGIDVTELPPLTAKGLAQGFSTVTDMLREYVRYAYQEKEHPDAELPPSRSLFTMLDYIEKDVSGVDYLRNYYIPDLRQEFDRRFQTSPSDTVGNLEPIDTIIPGSPDDVLFEETLPHDPFDPDVIPIDEVPERYRHRVRPQEDPHMQVVYLLIASRVYIDLADRYLLKGNELKF
jgi:hypothetical protein